MEQLALVIRTRGGAREGAGRPRARAMPHAARGRVTKSVPVLVTLRVANDVPTLRQPERFAILREAVAAAGSEEGHIAHFTAEDDHVQFIAEVRDRAALTRLVQRFSIRVSRRLNACLGRRGRLFVDRYHAQRVESPKQCRATIAYVLNNHRHHAHDRGETLPADWLDPYSSAVCFDGWADRPDVFASWWSADACERPRTWLLAMGWQQRGLIPVGEIPAMRRRKRRASPG